jgi:4-amino-4-deoxy-L-arabinose transferase-like glycosyltransferase
VIGVRDERGRGAPGVTAARARASLRHAASAVLQTVRRRRWLLGLLLLYGALQLVLRPASPFEWDEVLFQRALDDYNVAHHSPHPPGYPLYVGVAKAVRWIVHDPLLALQLVAVVAALASLALVYRLAVRVTGSVAGGVAAAALLAAMPSFAYHADLGLSDVPGVAAALLAVAALSAACERPALLPWGAACAAAALGVRPALLPVLLPVGALALWRARAARSWRSVAVAVAVAVAVTGAIWLPAIHATGPEFWGAVKLQARYAADVGRTQRLPGGSPALVLPAWFVRPFGAPALAATFWLLVVAGAVVWWRTGRRRLVGIAGGSAFAYLLACLFTLEASVGVRYVLPAVPFLALLAAGVVAARRPLGRRVGVALVALWCGAALAWNAPVLLLRRQSAPVWAALSWVRGHFDPARTTVVFDGVIEPHVYYLLAGAGFTVVEAKPTVTYGDWLRPDGSVLYACPLPVPGGEVLFESRWSSKRLRTLTRNRYYSCAITRAPEPRQPVFSPEWRVREGDWELWGTGSICLGDDAPPFGVVLQAGDGQLRLQQAAAAAATVKPGLPVAATVMPGPAGCLLVSAPAGAHAHLPPVRLHPLRAGERDDDVMDAAVIPLLTGVDEANGARWRSDVTISNLGTRPLSLVAQFLPEGRDNSAAPSLELTLPPGPAYRVQDVIGAGGLSAWGRSGALLLWTDERTCAEPGGECAFAAFARTYNTHAPRKGPYLNEGMPALAARRGLYGGGIAAFEHVSNDERYRSYLSLATWMPVPARARVTLRDGARQVVGESEFELPPFGQTLVPFPGTVSDGQLLVRLVGQPATALFYPAVTMVETATGEPTHLLGTPSRKEAPAEWLAVRPQRLPLGPPPRVAPERGARSGRR